MSFRLAAFLSFLCLLSLLNSPAVSQNNSQSALETARKEFYKNQYPQAISLLEKYLATNPQSEEVLLLKASCYDKLGQPQFALESYLQASATFPNSHLVWKRLGQAQLESGANQEAADSFSKAIKLDPLNAELYLLRAKPESLIIQYKRALADLETSAKLPKGKEETTKQYALTRRLAKIRRAHLLAKLGQFKEAKALFDKAKDPLDSQSDGEFFWAQGEMFYLQGDNASALKNFSMAIEHNPNWAPAYCDRAIIESGAQEYQKALADLKTSIGKASVKDLDRVSAFNWKAQGWGRLAELELEHGDCDKAIRDFREALKYASGQERANLLAHQGRAYAQIGQRADAWTAFTQASATDDSSPVVHLEKGQEFYLEGDYAKAIAELTRSLDALTKEGMPATSTTVCSVRIARGKAYLKAGDDKQAKADFVCALDGQAKSIKDEAAKLLRGAQK